eukprot:94601-Chlamydomonas_euryale.AAC.1
MGRLRLLIKGVGPLIEGVGVFIKGRGCAHLGGLAKVVPHAFWKAWEAFNIAQVTYVILNLEFET